MQFNVNDELESDLVIFCDVGRKQHLLIRVLRSDEAFSSCRFVPVVHLGRCSNNWT